MTTLFISDLHLDEQRPEITQLFLDFLKTKTHTATALYILGDFFEAWVGDDHKTPLNNRITQALADFTQQNTGSNPKLYFMHGNRDFLLGETFANACGGQLLAEPTLIDLYGRPTLLMHGDALCTQDVEYQTFKTMIRQPGVIENFLNKPLTERLMIASQLRQNSMAKASLKAENIMDVTPDEVVKVMQEHQVKLLIHGHTHRPKHHHIKTAQGETLERIVLGAWHDSGSVLVCNESSQTLTEIPLKAYSA